MGRVVVVGASGHARVVIDAIEREARHEIIGLIDSRKEPGERIKEYEILGDEYAIPGLMESGRVDEIVVAIGDNFTRSMVVERIEELQPAIRFVTAVHPGAMVASDVSLGEGTVVMAGATVNSGCSIGRHCILNTNSSLDHDSAMEDYASLAPGVVTGGNCKIAAHSAIGIGAILIHGVEVGEHTVIGAGSIVLKGVEPRKVAYGSPAKIVRSREPGDPYL